MKRIVPLLVVLFWAMPDFAQQQQPIFDTHVHYSHGTWDVYSPAQILEKFDKAGVAKALVSSRPDDGTMKMLAAATKRIVAGFRPYKKSTSTTGWFNDPELLPYTEARLAKRLHRVFGEIHLFGAEILETPGMTRYL